MAQYTKIKKEQLLNITSGTYTPTLYNTTNIAASTAYQCQYMRIGSVVVVSGKVDIDPTSASTNTVLGISLPVASNIGNDYELGGSASSNSAANGISRILGDATNDRAIFAYVSGTGVANVSWTFVFMYLVT